MHRYKQIEYKAGATREVIRCIPKGMRKGIARGPREKKNREEIAQANMRQAARRLARKINANFRPGDLHVTLTYRPKERPDREQAQKNIKKLLDDLRRAYKKAGKMLKYILVTEYKNKAIHHHLIINNINDGSRTTQDYIRGFWKDRGSPKYVQLYDDAEYRVLAEYLIKETEKTFREQDSPVKQRYSCSRNLVDPKPESRIRKTKNGWKLDPEPRAGYYIIPETIYNGFDRAGYPYQRYVMVKLRPEDSDWPPDDLPRGKGKHEIHRKHKGNRKGQ